MGLSAYLKTIDPGLRPPVLYVVIGNSTSDLPAIYLTVLSLLRLVMMSILILFLPHSCALSHSKPTSGVRH